MKTHTPIRQGDILLIPVAQRDIPKGIVPVDRDERGRVVLAEGETTGHCHAIVDDPVTLLDEGHYIVRHTSDGTSACHASASRRRHA